MITINDITQEERDAIVDALDNDNRINLYRVPKDTLKSVIDKEIAAPRDDDENTSSITLTITGYLLAKNFVKEDRDKAKVEIDKEVLKLYKDTDRGSVERHLGLLRILDNMLK